MRIKVLEKEVLSKVMQYLRSEKCLCYRMNTGAGLFSNPTGKQRFVRFGEKGMADILAFTKSGTTLWVECKGSSGKQSELQRHFQGQIEAYNHIYIVAHGVEDLYPLFGGVKK